MIGVNMKINITYFPQGLHSRLGVVLPVNSSKVLFEELNGLFECLSSNLWVVGVGVSLIHEGMTSIPHVEGEIDTSFLGGGLKSVSSLRV